MKCSPTRSAFVDGRMGVAIAVIRPVERRRVVHSQAISSAKPYLGQRPRPSDASQPCRIPPTTDSSVLAGSIPRRCRLLSEPLGIRVLPSSCSCLQLSPTPRTDRLRRLRVRAHDAPRFSRGVETAARTPRTAASTLRASCTAAKSETALGGTSKGSVQSHPGASQLAVRPALAGAGLFPASRQHSPLRNRANHSTRHACSYMQYGHTSILSLPQSFGNSACVPESFRNIREPFTLGLVLPNQAFAFAVVII